MKARPILFSGAMVRAILSGKKTQTRRVIKTPERFSNIRNCAFCCPYGVHAALDSDRLWVRETFSHHVGADALKETAYCDYRADQLPDDAAIHWTPSIFMPRWASRITLEITDVRVERLNEISEDDAIAEGAHRKIWITSPISAGAMGARGERGTHREGYKEIWEDINGVGSWANNPFCWALTFKRV